MKKIIFVYLIFLIILLTFFLFYPKSIEKNGTEKLKIAATIFPIYDIASNIVKDKADIIQILPAGASPHTFELTPQKVKELQGAKIVFKIGGLDDWINSISDSMPDTNKIELKKNIELIKSESEDNDEENTESDHEYYNREYDPHYWLSVPNAIIIAKNISDEMSLIDPDNEEFYFNNFTEYKKKLETAQNQIQDKLNGIKNNKVIFFHAGWHYFAKEYGLEIAGIFEPAPGQEPTAKIIENIIEASKTNNIKAIFSEPQFSDDLISQIAKDTGLKIYQLDPIGGNEESKNTYIKLMIYNANTISEALQ